MCHGFMASKDTGDRLSHAVGCSFAVCLERKQKRDAKLTDLKSNTPNTTTTNLSLNSAGSSVINSSLNSTTTDLDQSSKQFNRTGSFRRLPLKQRMKDPQEAKLIGKFSLDHYLDYHLDLTILRCLTNSSIHFPPRSFTCQRST